MKNTSGEIKGLQGCINDLISVVSLPAIWKSFDTSQIVRNLIESLVGMLRLDFGYARLNDCNNGSSIEILDLFQHEKKSIQPQAVGQKLEQWLAGNPPSTPVVIPNPVGAGKVSMIFFRLGAEGEIGLFAVGSGRKDFPTRNEMLILQVAANQAALGLQNARIQSKQKPREFNQKAAERSEQFTAANEELSKEITERKRAEEALRTSEERFRSYFSLGLVGMAVTSATKGIMEVNDELCRILGYQKSELLQMTWAELTHPEDLAADVANFQRVLAGEIDGYTIDKRWIRKDGQIIDTIMSAKCLRRADGSVDYFVGLVQDITRRKLSEKAIKFQADLLDTVQQAVIATDLKGSITYWNEFAENLYGWSSAEVIGPNIVEITPSTTMQEQASEIMSHLNEGKSWSGEVLLSRKDGTTFPAMVNDSPVYDDRGTLIGIVGISFDISERKIAEDILKESNKELQHLNEELKITAEELQSSKDELHKVNRELEEKAADVITANNDLRNLIDSTEIGTIFLDRELRIKRYTPHIEKLFNILPTDIDQPLGRFTHRLDHLHLQEDARQVLADLKNVEREILSKDGHWYIVRLLPYRTQEEDKIDGVVATFVEITERKRTEEALQKAQAELAHVIRVTTLGEFTASIAHEVNQPLGAIVINGQACLRLLAGDPVDLNEARDAVECTINDALRASEVIKRIRALLKKNAPEKSLLDINETIQEVIRMVSGELVKNRILLRTELEKNLPPVFGDRIQLQQVVLNLILNAKEAMSSKGWKQRELLISSEKSEAATAMVTVRDSGKGFDSKISERLFDAFFTTKKKAGGLGLGLSISRTIIEAHGGRLWSAPNEDKGAIFRFTIPTSDENLL